MMIYMYYGVQMINLGTILPHRKGHGLNTAVSCDTRTFHVETIQPEATKIAVMGNEYQVINNSAECPTPPSIAWVQKLPKKSQHFTTTEIFNIE